MAVKGYTIGASAVAGALVFILLLSKSIDAVAANDSTVDYPRNTKYTYYNGLYNHTFCLYGKNEILTEEHTALEFYIRNNTMRTHAINCPKIGNETAFRAGWWGTPDLHSYQTVYPYHGEPWYYFIDHPLPDDTGLDPLRELPSEL
ncbi:hypothetical protein FOZ60_016793 [Perkinsus olseni]|uniref:Uncharacterized protein n=1 Tax=Perkinsus olseni TaxID=32597 RepID=A0A7J6P4Y0_PEROL|nr:hypothetical protein FOZ60_016793 [Perkinsus olseni]